MKSLTTKGGGAFGAWMVEERKRQGLTQNDLAELTGFHKAHISNVERGERDPSTDFVEAVAKALKFDAHDARVIAGIDEAPSTIPSGIPENQAARMNRIRRRIEVEPGNEAEREEALTLIEAVLDGQARARRRREGGSS